MEIASHTFLVTGSVWIEVRHVHGGWRGWAATWSWQSILNEAAGNRRNTP